jgi:hypothetical protein
VTGISTRKKDMNRKLTKIALPWLILVLMLPMLVMLSTAKPVEAGCPCGGDGGSTSPPATRTVSVDVSPSGGGDVEVKGRVPSSYPAKRTVTKGGSVHLEAQPAPGYYFVSWSGDLIGNENPTDVRIDTNTTIVAHFFLEEFVSEDEMLHIVVPEGTVVLDKDGEPLTSLELIINETPLPPPPEANIVGLTYELGPDGTSFDQAITITCSYDPYEIPLEVAEEELVIAYYDEDVGEWLVAPSVVDVVNNTVTILVDHLSTLTIVAPVPIPVPVPAAFTPSSLSIFPPEANIGETVRISVLVTNTGEQEASYTVTLKINETVEETREITLAGGSEMVTFTTAKDEAGTYSVDVNSLTGSFIVKEAPPVVEEEPQSQPPAPPTGVKWTILGPILAVIIFLAIFLPIRVRRRRAFR